MISFLAAKQMQSGSRCELWPSKMRRRGRPFSTAPAENAWKMRVVHQMSRGDTRNGTKPLQRTNIVDEHFHPTAIRSSGHECLGRAHLLDELPAPKKLVSLEQQHWFARFSIAARGSNQRNMRQIVLGNAHNFTRGHEFHFHVNHRKANLVHIVSE